MPDAADIADFLPALFGLAAVLIIVSRLVRIARLSSPPAGDVPAAAPPRPLWGKARKLRIFGEDTALARAETQYLTSAGDRLQARHNLDRLTAELGPAPPPAPATQPAGAPSLTIAEIAAVLARVPMPAQLRATVLDLLETTANEKIAP
jgi:hypothetical protein